MDGIEVQITEEKSLDRKGERETERVGLFSYGTEILGNNSKIARHHGKTMEKGAIFGICTYIGMSSKYIF